MRIYNQEPIAVLIRKKITSGKNPFTPSNIANWITYKGVDITERIITTQINSLGFVPHVLELSNGREINGALKSQVALVSINDPIALGYLVKNRSIIEKKFKTLVIGGQIPSLIPEKISKMFPSANIFVGECEGSIQSIIITAMAGKKGEIYRAPFVNLETDYVIPDPSYKPSTLMYSTELGRGCKYGCGFCGMPDNTRVRIRNPLQIIEELNRVKSRLLFVDPNLSVYPLEYLETIFSYLEKKRKFWVGEGSSKELIKHPEIWDLMSRTCVGFLTGFEDPKLIELKGNKNGTKVLEQKNGVMVLNSSIIGHPKQDEESLLEMARIFRENNLTGTFQIYAPYPGTPDFKRLKESNALLEDNFFRYNRKIPVVDTPMGPKKTMELFRKVNKNAQTISGTLKEIIRVIKDTRHSFKLMLLRIASIVGIRIRNYLQGQEINYCKEDINIPIDD